MRNDEARLKLAAAKALLTDLVENWGFSLDLEEAVEQISFVERRDDEDPIGMPNVKVKRYLDAIAARGGVPTTPYLETLEACETLIAKARLDLGQDLGGFGIYNLLCDNSEENGDLLRLVMQDLGES